MTEHEGAREAVLSRLRARLDRLGDLVGVGEAVELREREEMIVPTSGIGPAPRSGLEAVLRAQERGRARAMPLHASRRASA